MLKDNRCVGLKMSDAYDYLAYLEMLPTSFYLFIFSVKKKVLKALIYGGHNTTLKQTSWIIWALDNEDAILIFYDWSKCNLDLDIFLPSFFPAFMINVNWNAIRY